MLFRSLTARRENAVIESDLSEDDAAAEIQKAFKDAGLKSTVTPTESTSYGVGPDGRKDFSQVITHRSLLVFGESRAWNRLGAYVIHVFLLTLFIGHFVAFQTGFDADVRMTPGERTEEIQLIQFNLDKKERYNVKLPFAIDCTDIQQKLIDENAGIDITNTLDWQIGRAHV